MLYVSQFCSLVHSSLESARTTYLRHIPNCTSPEAADYQFDSSSFQNLFRCIYIKSIIISSAITGVEKTKFCSLQTELASATKKNKNKTLHMFFVLSIFTFFFSPLSLPYYQLFPLHMKTKTVCRKFLESFSFTFI